jgi:transmembrane sensor
MTDRHDILWERIASKLHGELNQDEEREFNELMMDSAHSQKYEDAKKIIGNLSQTGAVSGGGRNKSWDKVEKKIKLYRLRWITVSLKYVAIIVFAFLVGTLYPPTTKNKEVRYSEIYVPFGQISQVILSDGTKIWLNSGTTLRYPEKFSETSRSVSVTGEAYFQVAKMQDKPFFVNSDNLKVEVLGTSFNFTSYKEDITASVILIEGSVDVQDTTGRTIATLHPGQMLTKHLRTNSIDMKEVKTAFYASWIEGKISFDDERLDQIAAKLERWFNVEISFDSEQLKSYRFTGTILKNKPVDQIMQAFELLSPIRFKHQVITNGKDKITIYKRT